MKCLHFLVAGAGLAAILVVSQANAALVTTNLVQHLDSDIGVNLSGGTDVASWDANGVGETVTTADGAPQLNAAALNGVDTISFDGDKMNGTSTSLYDFGTGELTWFAVVNVSSNTGTNGRNVFGTLENGGGYNGLELDRNGNFMTAKFRTDEGPDTNVNELSGSFDAWRIYTGRRIGNTVEFWVDGVKQNDAVNASTITGDGLAVGAERTGGTEFAVFEIAHLSFYDAGLAGDATTGDFAEMGLYLENRYGLDTAFVPEPASLALMGIGGVVMMVHRRK